MSPFGFAGNSGRNMNAKQGIRKRDIASYIFLPRVLPRIGELFFSGFHFFAFFMAQVYRGVRLLPADHPSLNPANIGNFTVRDVISEAFRHLVWRKENIDQIIVFLAILAGLVLLILQAATFMLAIAVPQATAAGISDIPFGFGAIFQVPPGGGKQDIAYILLDRVFGVPGIFNSCVADTNTPCAGVSPDGMKFDTSNPIYKPDSFPWPYHNGLHALFQFYSMGLLLVAVFILLYFIVVIVAETAQTGTPFGKRFNTVWAPIRLVVAFGLLIPITNGLNSAQYITLYAAKWGSNFATHGWMLFNYTMDASAQDKAASMAGNLNLVVKPKEPDVAGLLQFMTLAHTCKVFEETVIKEEPDQTTTTSTNNTATNTCSSDLAGRKIEAYIVKPGTDANTSQAILTSQSYAQAKVFNENNDIQIRFGDRNCNKNYAMAGNVEPICGEITLPINSLTEVGAESIQEGYYNLIRYLWGGFTSGGSGSDIQSYSNTTAAGNGADTRPEKNACVPAEYNKVLQSGQGNKDAVLRRNALYYYQETQCIKATNSDYTLVTTPDTGWKKAATDSYTFGNETPGNETPVSQKTTSGDVYKVTDQNMIVRNILKKGVTDLQAALKTDKYQVSDDNLQRGWATAGIWYNKIAEMNGALIGAAWDIPAPNRYPQIMMTVLQEKRQKNAQTAPSDMFCPNDSQGATNSLPGGDKGRAYAQAMCEVYKTWNTEGRQVQPTGNVLADFVNTIFGTQGLFDLRYQQNNRAHPLAMLVGVGKGLIEASIRNLGIGMGSGILSIVASLGLGAGAGPELLGAVSSFFFSIATMTLTAGFILFYVIPFLPFLYFFFAVGNWLKGVFEAMVGVPLWALAHLRIDGNGLPGEAAINGYFMLFEIFLRPILIVFGFLASVTIFAAMATVLHEVFKVAVDNLTGASGSGASQAIDNFFYTVMYAVIMYIMALSSFKLIDLIPNQLMRWMGSSVSTFSDMNQDAAGNLTNMTAIAGSQIVGGMTGGLQQGMGGLRQGAGAINKGVMGGGK